MSKLPSEDTIRAKSEPRSKQEDHQTNYSSPSRLITKAELRRIVPYTPQHILRLEKRGMFPRRVQVGANRVGWLLSEIEDWVAARVAERDCSPR